MNILLIGSGGREHSIARKIAESPRLKRLYTAPGNPGTDEYGENVPILETDYEKLLSFAMNNNITMVIVGPEAPLAEGIADMFRSHGIACVGPGKEGAMLESSKKWAKSFMDRWNIPTASYKSFSNAESAKAYVKSHNEFPIVIKADGLAAGKGVTIAHNYEEAEETLTKIMVERVFSDAGTEVVIEAFLRGEEASILAFTDGRVILPMASAQDHKAVLDGDNGPNTGGMGAYSPAPVIDAEMEARIQTEIFEPLLKGLQSEKIAYQGIVYAGLMIQEGNPYVIEFNCRFGDPETQVVLPRMKNDLLDLLEATTIGTLGNHPLEWKEDSAVCVVLASEGYPGTYPKGLKISGLEKTDTETTFAIHAGTKKENGEISTSGGRVLGIVGIDKALETAISKTYETVDKVTFQGMHYRKDIAAKALNR